MGHGDLHKAFPAIYDENDVPYPTFAPKVAHGTTLVTGDFVQCPYCLRTQEDNPVEDFVVPMHYGQPNKEPCCWCKEEFHVTQLDRDTYKVTK